MWIHWSKKIMRFTHKGRRVVLHGVKQQVQDYKPISASKLQGLFRREVVQHCLQVKWTGDHSHLEESSSEVSSIGMETVEEVPHQI
jgi:hypothetical protein